ncbi:MAG: phospholipase D-like domain-containing protein [Phormidesmis sp.]
MGLLIDILLWLLAAVLALVAIVLLSLYIRGAFRWRALFHIEQALAPNDPHFLTAIKSITNSLETKGQVIDFWDTADEIQQARLDAINGAKRSIQFETFMMTPGKRANDFADALARKAIEGVKIQLLVDSWGTRSLNDKYWERLRSVGVQIVFFNPFDWRAPANYAGRTHRKLLIIDSDYVLTGGAGISNLWDGTEKSDDTQPWLDVEAALRGEVVKVLATTFQVHWQGYRRKHSEVTSIDMEMVYPRVAPEISVASKEPAPTPSSILVTPGAKPSYRNSPIEMIKQSLITSARQRLWLSSPYFLPNLSTRQLLIEAQQAGVDVRILTTSDRSDKKPVYYASFEVYGSLLKAGIKIFEYQPSMLHAKMLIVDDDWVNIGSANFDYRSFLHNDELDIVTNSDRLIQQVESVFEKGFADSEQIGLKQWQQRSWPQHRILGNLVRLVQWQL